MNVVGPLLVGVELDPKIDGLIISHRLLETVVERDIADHLGEPPLDEWFLLSSKCLMSRIIRRRDSHRRIDHENTFA
jgi:hypothetical protein